MAEWQDSLVLISFFPVAAVSRILLDTENIFLCYNSRAIPNTHRHLTQREILVTTSSVGDMTWILMESKGPL